MVFGKTARPNGLVGLAALCLLTEQPLHPYEMQRLLHERRKGFAEGKTRALYRGIEELAGLGWVEPVETTREGRRPERTVYRITPEGRDALEDWLADLIEQRAAEHPAFRVAVGLLPYLSQERALPALQLRLVELRARLATLGEVLTALEELRLPRIVLLEHEHERVLLEAEMRWVEAVVDDVRAGRLRWSEEILLQQFAAMHGGHGTHRAEPRPPRPPHGATAE